MNDLLLLFNLVTMGIIAYYVIQNNSILKQEQQQYFIEYGDNMGEAQEPTPEQGEPVNLKRFVPNVSDWDQLNELLLSIGAMVILTEHKNLEDVGHNPDHWKELESE